MLNIPPDFFLDMSFQLYQGTISKRNYQKGEWKHDLVINTC